APLHFDDLDGINNTINPSANTVPNGYHCLKWNNVQVLNTENSSGGWKNGIVSQPNIIINKVGFLATISRDKTVQPISVYATATNYDGLLTSFTGLLGGNYVCNIDATLHTSGPQLIDLSSIGSIDTLNLMGKQGEDIGIHVLDDFTIEGAC
ncbi:hypothetical protein Unana1_02664, partial [Umbelopsis nana]